MPPLTRRRFTTLAGAALIGSFAGRPSFGLAADRIGTDWAQAFTAIETTVGGRLGVAAHDTATGQRLAHRPDERFPMCSTFKLVACGAVLARVDAGKEDLARRIRFEAKDLVAYSPGTKSRVGGEGMTLAEICAAAMTLSDNTAGNLILATIGGPAGLTAFARSLGDTATRLDRIETALNECAPGDPRDTTTPAAMTKTLHTLLSGERLSMRSRTQLMDWMLANTTGSTRLRAGVPADWRVGDKTGSGDFGTTNDIAILWPPARPPLLVSVYLTESKASFAARNEAIAAVGQAIARLY